MMFGHCPHRPLHRLLVMVPAVFGLVTIVAAGRILLGLGTAEHVVFRPLLVFNGVMGIVYVATALAIRSDPVRGRRFAIGVAALNLLVLGTIVLLRAGGGPIAGESVQAMVFRLAVWLAVAGGLTWLLRAGRPAGPPVPAA
jgi:hypothetical protein